MESKLMPQMYGLCPKCKHEEDYASDRCLECVSFAGTGASMLLCGIPVGTSGYYMHKNYEPKEVIADDRK